MRYRVSILMLAFALVATLSFAVGEEESEASDAAETVGPIYGGTLTFGHIHMWLPAGAYRWLPGGQVVRTWHLPYMDTLMVGDIEKYGARGTGENLFRTSSYTEVIWQPGSHALAESWEVSADKIVFHIRPGVMWTGKEGIMESRELTADDIVYALLIDVGPESPERAIALPWIDDIYSTDRYTVVIDTNRFDGEWHYYVNHFMGIFPPELYADRDRIDPSDWRNQIGTGPFTLTDYVPGVHTRYERNPLYWDTTIIDGEEYQLPFIDELIFPSIEDESTRIAALRTGTLDFLEIVTPAHTETLDATSPDMERVAHNDDESLKLTMDTSKPPLNDVNVRRALWRATDFHAINDGVYFGQGILHNNPMNPNTLGYVPREELSASEREMWEHDSEIARQMLADAGYPDGFEVELAFVAGQPQHEDIVALLIEQWAEVNVEIKPRPVGVGELFPLLFGAGNEGYNDMILHQYGNDPPFSISSGQMPREYGRNLSRYYDDNKWHEMYERTIGTVDFDERVTRIKELNAYWREIATRIVMPQPALSAYWWPWVKNYYGELNASTRNPVPAISRLWIDQGLKAQMGY
jgi:peptide/nickel transport system substrate-binding protein